MTQDMDISDDTSFEVEAGSGDEVAEHCGRGERVQWKRSMAASEGMRASEGPTKGPSFFSDPMVERCAAQGRVLSSVPV